MCFYCDRDLSLVPQAVPPPSVSTSEMIRLMLSLMEARDPNRGSPISELSESFYGCYLFKESR